MPHHLIVNHGDKGECRCAPIAQEIDRVGFSRSAEGLLVHAANGGDVRRFFTSNDHARHSVHFLTKSLASLRVLGLAQSICCCTKARMRSCSRAVTSAKYSSRDGMAWLMISA